MPRNLGAGMSSLLRRLFKRRKTEAKDDAVSGFSARFHRFKLFLNAHIEAYSEMMSFEERLASEMPVGMPFLRSSTARLTISTMQCILHLNSLGGNRYTRLNAPFSALRGQVQDVLRKGVAPLVGSLVFPYREINEDNRSLVAPNLAKLRAIGREHPEFMPEGFVVGGAAWWSWFNDPDMHDEIDRIMLISQDDPGTYSEAGATIRERIVSSFPLPKEVEVAVRPFLKNLEGALADPENILLVRCFPVKPEHGALTVPEQVLCAPVTEEAVFTALRSAFSMAYTARAMIYRLKLGIRDRAMPLCACFTLLRARQGRGSTHRRLDAVGNDELIVHIRRGIDTAESSTGQFSDEAARLPDEVRAEVERCSRLALTCVADAPVAGNRHEVFWAVSERGEYSVLGVNALPDPDPTLSLGTAPPCAPAGDAPSILTLSGGLSTYPGRAEGRAAVVNNLKDALHFPIGSILLTPKAGPRWSFLLDFARGAVAGNGTGNGLFARTARRRGRPTILNLPEALKATENGMSVRIFASSDRSPTLCLYRVGAETRNDAPCCTTEPEAGAFSGEFTDDDHNQAAGHLWLPRSDIAEMTRALAPKVVSLTLPDSDNPDFRADNCSTFHDFLVYCHDHAVQEMFRYSTSRKASQAPAKQLICDVPKQFWIINLDDGFYSEITGPTVPLEKIASIPMRTLWEGFCDKPWEGPPQLDARGFISVLFEATTNPNLDPASGVAQYTEKNVFLIARHFCSMRCRFGFHFLSLDCLLGDRARERFIIFQFKGGAANLSRRIRRVHFVAELLSQFDFATEISGDTLTARLEQGEHDEFLSALRILGYLVMHTRQLDMIMADEEALARHRLVMMDDMLRLAARPPMEMR